MNKRKRIKTLIALSVIILSLIAYSRNNNNNATLYKVKTEIDTNINSSVLGIDRHLYTYDGQGRLLQDFDSFTVYEPGLSDSGSYTFTYTYASATINKSLTQGRIAGLMSGSPLLYKLNLQGKVMEIVGQNGTTLQFLQYDAQGYCIKDSLNGGGGWINIISSGNRVETIQISSNYFKRDFSYSTAADIRDFGTAFLGVRSKNVQIGYGDSCNCPGNGTTFAALHDFDNLGRITYESLEQSVRSVYTYY